MPDEDVITVWLARYCEPDIGAWVSLDALHASYEALCQRWEEPTFARREFADIVDRLGFYRQRCDRVNGFRGLRLSCAPPTDKPDATLERKFDGRK